MRYYRCFVCGKFHYEGECKHSVTNEFYQLKENKMETECLAEKLYTTYCAAVGGVAFNGDTLPTWEEFSADPDKQKQIIAWLDVAATAKETLTSE